MKTTALIAVTALAAVPATAAARPASGHGQGQTHRSAGENGTGHARAHKAPAARCARPQRVAFVARGSLVSFTPTADTTDGPNVGDLVLKVVRANHHARSYTSGTPLSTEGARVTFRGVTDSTADGAVGFDDVVGTDSVMVIGKLVRPKRGCSGDTSVVLRKVMVKRNPPPDQAGEGQQAPAQG